MAYFPFFVNLEGKQVLVIGGGTIAARRVRALLAFGCRILVAAPELGTEMKQLMAEIGEEAVKNGKINPLGWKCEEYRRELLCASESDGKYSNYAFVLAAALPQVNQQVAEDCHAAGILVNDASKKENCDFYFPGLVKEEQIVVGVTASGSDHKRVAALTKRIREMIREQDDDSMSHL